MKKILILVALMVTAIVQLSVAQSDAKHSLLAGYYGIKNALVQSDPAATAVKAGEFFKTADNADFKSLSPADAKLIRASLVKLSFDARHISESKDIAHQREHFASLSLNFSKLARTVKLSDQPVYYDYCPMNKTYWLSAEKAIKNPYYGKQMLDCGAVKETL